MKRFLFLVSIVWFYSCGENAGNTPVVPTVDSSAIKIHSYHYYLDTLDATEINNASVGLVRLRQQFAQAEDSAKELAMKRFLVFHDKVLKELNEKLVSDSHYHDLSQALVRQDTIDVIQKRLLDSINANGFVFETAEGSAFAVRNWAWVLGKGEAVTPALQDFIHQMDREQKQVFARDAAIVISPQELVDRTIWWERFIQLHPHSVFIEEAKKRHSLFLNILLNGMDNAPLSTNRQLNDFYREAQSYLEDNYNNTETSRRVIAHYEQKQLIHK